MACTDGNCNNVWESLCSYIGQICINIETVIGGLISNQNTLRNKVERYDESAAAFPECTMLYIDTAACTVTDTPSDTTFPYGSHIGDGFVQTTGKVICAAVDGAAGQAPPACTPVDSSFAEITDETKPFGYTIGEQEDGCSPVLIGCQCEEIEEIELFGYVNNTQAVPTDATDFSFTGTQITIPKDGYYTISYWVNGSKGTPDLTRVETWVLLERNGFNYLYDEKSVAAVDDGFVMGGIADVCFLAGDVLYMQTFCQTLVGVASTVEFAQRYVQARYLGDYNC